MTRPDMSRSNAGYLVGIAVLAGTYFLVHHYGVKFDFPHAKQVTLALFSIALLLTLWSAVLHSKRSSKPWAVNAATVNILFSGGFLTGLGAMLLSHSLV